MTVIFLARNLVVGGAERALLHLVNRADGFAPVLALLHKSGRLLPELDPNVPLFDISDGAREPTTVDRRPETNHEPVSPGAADEDAEPAGGGPVALLIEAARLRRLASATDAEVVSSFLMRPHLVAILAKTVFRMRARVVLNVHVHVSQSARFLYPFPAKRRLMRFLVRRTFPLADRILVVAHSVREDLIHQFGIPPSKVEVVRNAVDLATILRNAEEAVDLPPVHDEGPKIVAVGRLVRLKGYDLLLRAVAELQTEQRPSVVILGDGPELQPLRRLAAELGIADRVLFPGYVRNPWKYMARADVVALPSRTEAFPNVIGEAMALGVPIVASHCSPGVSEYLRGGELGLLVAPEDVAALRRGMEIALEDQAARERLASRGAERVKEFDVARAVPAYGKALRTEANGTGS